jgi:hypothetical protein
MPFINFGAAIVVGAAMVCVFMQIAKTAPRAATESL